MPDDRTSALIHHAGRHFDAPPSDSVSRSVLAMLRGNWRVVFALIVASSILEMVAAGVPLISAIGSRALDASIGSISILVAVDPQASHADVDALGPLIRATPGIAEAGFRSKDDAIKSLAARGLPPPEGRNPLPDVWVARVNAAAIGPDRPVATVVAEARRALAVLPRVESATADDSWVRSTGRVVEWWHKARPIAWVAGLGLGSLTLFCLAFLAGGSLMNPTPGRSTRAIVGVMAALVSTGIGCAIDGLLVAQLNVAPVPRLEGSFGELMAEQTGPISVICVCSMLILAGGLLVGGRRR